MSDSRWEPLEDEGFMLRDSCHVYKNGLDLGRHHRVLADLRRFDPQLVLTGHTAPDR